MMYRHFVSQTSLEVFLSLIRSTDFDIVPENAAIVRDSGIITFAIGVGEANEAELRVSRIFRQNDFFSKHGRTFRSLFAWLRSLLRSLSDSLHNLFLPGH